MTEPEEPVEEQPVRERRYLHREEGVWECVTCGCLVGDLAAHDRKHDPRRVTKPEPDPRRTRGADQ